MSKHRDQEAPKTVELSAEALHCLRTMVAWKVAGNPSLGQDVLDREFGREVWEEVARVKPPLMKSRMYGAHALTPRAVFVAMGWEEQ